MFKRSCSAIQRIKTQNVKWPTYIRANDYVSDKTNFKSNESLLKKKPAESDFHLHAGNSKIFVYFFFQTFQSHFIDFYANKTKTLKNIPFFSVFFHFDMPTIPKNLRERAIDMLNVGMTMNSVAMNIGCSTRAFRHLRQRFQATGRTEDRPRSGSPRVTTRGQGRYIRNMHLAIASNCHSYCC